MAQYSWDFQQDTPGQLPQGWRVEDLFADNVSLSVAVSQGQTLLWETSNYTPPGEPAASTFLEAENVTPTTTGEVEMVAIFRFLPGEPWGPEPDAIMEVSLELWEGIDAESGLFAAVNLEIHNIWTEEPGFIQAGWWTEDDNGWDGADFEGLEPGTWYVLRHTVTTSSVAATLSEFESGQQIVSLAVPLTTPLEPDLHVLYAGQLDYESAAIEFQWIGIGTDGDPAPMPEEGTPVSITAQTRRVLTVAAAAHGQTRRALSAVVDVAGQTRRRLTELVATTGQTRRILTALATALAQTRRQLHALVAVAGQTRRRLQAAVDVFGQTRRRLGVFVSTLGQTRRRLTAAVATLGQTRRRLFDPRFKPVPPPSPAEWQAADRPDTSWTPVEAQTTDWNER